MERTGGLVHRHQGQGQRRLRGREAKARQHLPCRGEAANPGQGRLPRIGKLVSGRLDGGRAGTGNKRLAEVAGKGEIPGAGLSGQSGSGTGAVDRQCLSEGQRIARHRSPLVAGQQVIDQLQELCHGGGKTRTGGQRLKLKFDPSLELQRDAIGAVVGVFEGQRKPSGQRIEAR